MTPPPAMVALINVSNSSSPLNTNRLVISGGPVPQRLDLNNRSDINGYKNILLHRTGISNSYSFGKAMNLSD